MEESGEAVLLFGNGDLARLRRRIGSSGSVPHRQWSAGNVGSAQSGADPIAK